MTGVHLHTSLNMIKKRDEGQGTRKKKRAERE